jgi:ferrous iron transport protein B
MNAALPLQPAAPPAAPPAAGRVALVGNPNTGKTTLFNRLCGLRAKTANFPGTTTDARIGRAVLPRPARGEALALEVTDLPGTYRLGIDLPEAEICRQVLSGAGLYRQPDAVIVVVDATNLNRNLCLVGELLGFGVPTVVALNMVDLAQRRGLTLDAGQLARRLGCPVVPIVARSGEGVPELLAATARTLAEGKTPPAPLPADAPFEDLVAWADDVVEASVGGKGSGADSLTERLDQAFTHPLLGAFAFTGIMAGLFWTVFALATVPMDLIELTFGVLGGTLQELLPAGAIRDLLVDGVVGGVAGTVVFLPQICLLFFLISLLEDTGYLARAAFVMDRLLCRFGLPGQAFVPLLSSHACALPGIMSTRLIPDRHDRLATILVAPFMSCSARLPVYVLLTGLLFEGRPLAAGLAFAGCYVLGAAVALGTAFVFRRTLLKGKSRPMVLELPSYKTPSLRTALATAYHQGKTFLEKAGTVIVAICVVMWWLSAYPQTEPPAEAVALEQQAETLRATAPEQAEDLALQAEFLIAKNAQGHSFAGRLGRALEPAFAPLGYDWQLTVGVFTSFLAREVFVSTMAVLLVGDPAVAEEEGVVDKVRGAQRDDGSPLFTPSTAASLLVFFVLAMQCLPTLAVTRRESGSWRWAALQLGYMTGLAWIAAFLTYHGLQAMGVA